MGYTDLLQAMKEAQGAGCRKLRALPWPCEPHEASPQEAGGVCCWDGLPPMHACPRLRILPAPRTAPGTNLAAELATDALRCNADTAKQICSRYEPNTWFFVVSHVARVAATPRVTVRPLCVCCGEGYFTVIVCYGADSLIAHSLLCRSSSRERRHARSSAHAPGLRQGHAEARDCPRW
jgi:hypothetical protein